MTINTDLLICLRFNKIFTFCAGPSRWEMDGNVAQNVGMSTIGRPNRYELLAWLNETLQTGFTKVEQICTGGSTCMCVLNV